MAVVMVTVMGHSELEGWQCRDPEIAEQCDGHKASYLGMDITGTSGYEQWLAQVFIMHVHMDGMDKSFQEFFSQQHSQFSPPSGQAK